MLGVLRRVALLVRVLVRLLELLRLDVVERLELERDFVWLLLDFLCLGALRFGALCFDMTGRDTDCFGTTGVGTFRFGLTCLDVAV